MANTYVDYTAVASQTDYNFSFEYLRDEHVKVKVNGTLVTNYTIVTSPTPTKIRFNTAPVAGADIKIYRDSRGDFSPLVDFVNGSVLTESELDESYKHNLFVSQESSEGSGGEQLTKKGLTDYDAEGNKIINLGTPTASTDAANKDYVDQTIDNAIALGGSPAIVSLGGYDVTALSSLTPRSLAARFSDTVNVLDYGAYNDGTNATATTTAIQNALNTNAKFVVFPAGTYAVDSTITLKSNQEIVGNNATISLTGSWSTAVFSGVDVSNSKIRDINVLGSTFNSTTSIISYTKSATSRIVGPTITNVNFENLECSSCISVVGYYSDSDWTLTNEPSASWDTYTDVKISNIDIKDIDVPASTFGVGAVSVTGVDRLIINNVKTTNTQERSISVGYGREFFVHDCSLNTVSNANASSNAHGVYIRTCKRFKINNVQVKIGSSPDSTNGADSFGVRLSRGAYDGAISNCVVIGAVSATNTAAGGISCNGLSNVTISGCTVETPGHALVLAGHASGDGTSGSASASYAPCTDIVVSGGSFTALTASKNAFLMNSVAVGTGEADGYPDIDNILVTGCKFKNEQTSAYSLGYLRMGDNCHLRDSIFVCPTPADYIVNMDVDDPRYSGANYSWTIKGCEIICDMSASDMTDETIRGINIPEFYAGAGARKPVSVTECKIANISVGVLTETRAQTQISGNQFINCRVGFKTSGPLNDDYRSTYVSNNTFYNLGFGLTSGSDIAIEASIVDSYISDNIHHVAGTDGIKFGSPISFGDGFIRNETYSGDKSFITSMPDDTGLIITGCIVNEGVATTTQVNPTINYNNGI